MLDKEEIEESLGEEGKSGINFGKMAWIEGVGSNVKSLLGQNNFA